MRLVVDSASVWSAGGEVLQAELAGALDRTCPDDASAVILRRTDQRRLHGFARLGDECVQQPMSTRLQRMSWTGWGAPDRARALSASAAFAASGVFGPQLRARCGVVTTTNNMLPFVPAELVAPRRLSVERLLLRAQRFVVSRCLRAADAVLLHSRHALETVARFAGDIHARATVVLTGVPAGSLLEAGRTPPHPNRGRPYLLYLSKFRRYKNHRRLVEAYALSARRAPDLPELVLAGESSDGQCSSEIEAAIDGAGMRGRVRLLGRLPDEELSAWLHHAEVNVFPSLCETNSTILAEILGHRGVMAASRTPPMPEVCETAAEYFDPLDLADIARVLVGLSRAPARRAELRDLAAARARELSWDACGIALWDLARRATERFHAGRR